jgi:phosphoribosylpyrophosphate synthetase
MQVLAFPESIEPARKLADTIGGEFGVIDIHRFPDGESLVTLPTRIAKSVIFFRSLHDPNAKLVELLLAIESARSNGCKRVMLIAPYLCYMRQDIAFKPGQAISQRIIGELLSEWVDDLITVDPHLHRITHLNVALPYCNSVAATASIALGDFIRQRNIQGLLVGPDEESAQWVEQVAQQAGMPRRKQTTFRRPRCESHSARCERARQTRNSGGRRDQFRQNHDRNRTGIERSRCQRRQRHLHPRPVCAWRPRRHAQRRHRSYLEHRQHSTQYQCSRSHSRAGGGAA